MWLWADPTDSEFRTSPLMRYFFAKSLMKNQMRLFRLYPIFKLFQTFRLSVSTALEGTQWVHWKSLKDTFQNTDGAKHVLDPAKLFIDTELFSSLGLICPRQNGLIFTIQICDTVKLALCLPNLLTSIGDRTQVI